ncbi:hypothetical protein BGZ58_004298 [Dissophora ornata]|nr:hypothetical protein BGZ58_004298 [Dissophora ornata]
MATEHGRQFAQRSRTSVNRLLDTVLDNATSLAESNAAHEPYPEEEELRKKQSHTAVKQRQAVSRAKFFVCNESEEDESESEDENENTFAVHHHSPRATLYSAPMVSSGETEEHDGDCEDFDVSEQEDNNDAEEEIYFGKKMPIVSNHHRTATTAPSQDQNTGGMERRQSLLSDLLMAEKRKQQQQACSETSAPNSDGEMTIARMAIPMPHIYPLAQQRNSSREPAFSETTPRSSLVRTKKVYKNLAELAKTSPVTRVAPITSATPVAPVITVTPSAPQRENSPLKTCNTAVSTTHSTASLSSASSPTTTCTLSASPILSTTGWTRSQVQVQIQSLVTQSTTTAQRALLTASATLTDVLFRTAQ